MSRDLREFFVPEAVEAVEREIDERVQAALEDARPQLEPSPWLSLADAADYLSVSRRTIDSKGGTMTRQQVRDSHGPVKGLFRRADGRYMSAFREGKRERMRTLRMNGIGGYDEHGSYVTSIRDAKRVQRSLLAGLEEGRIAPKSAATFADLFAEWQQGRSISERTAAHEAVVARRYLSHLDERRVQHIDARDLARVLNDMRRDGLSEWTRTHVYRVLYGVFALAVRRGDVTKNPVDGLSKAERPTQENARKIRRLDPAELERLISAGGSERWSVAIALAGHAGLRVGEIRGLRWRDIARDGATITVRRSALPSGEMKTPKTKAGERSIPIVPALRSRLIEWRLRSPFSTDDDLVIPSHAGRCVAPENTRRALSSAIKAAGLDGGSERPSFHSLRHDYGSTLVLASVPITTVARLMGHTNPGFTFGHTRTTPATRRP